MKDLKTLLREGDPLAHEEPIPSDAIDVMRQKIVAAARSVEQRHVTWRQPLAMAAMVALMVVAGVLATRWTPASSPDVDVAPAAAGEPADGRRQMQFATPGGTRIIWVFDPEFQVKETLP